MWKFEVLIWKSFQVCFRVFQSQQVLTAMIDAPVVKSCCCINHSGAVVHTAAQGPLEDLKLVHKPAKCAFNSDSALGEVMVESILCLVLLVNSRKRCEKVF